MISLIIASALAAMTAYICGYFAGLYDERKTNRRREVAAGPNGRVHVADDGSLWAEITNRPGRYVGPCDSLDDLMFEIHRQELGGLA